ncbi:MAG: hypothetical protein EBR71_13065, partial [Planctomycetes bacterium]|nr:hypothetical protein [Planctomycetota bacterium]
MLALLRLVVVHQPVAGGAADVLQNFKDQRRKGLFIQRTDRLLELGHALDQVLLQLRLAAGACHQVTISRHMRSRYCRRS